MTPDMIYYLKYSQSQAKMWVKTTKMVVKMAKMGVITGGGCDKASDDKRVQTEILTT